MPRILRKIFVPVFLRMRALCSLSLVSSSLRFSGGNVTIALTSIRGGESL